MSANDRNAVLNVHLIASAQKPSGEADWGSSNPCRVAMTASGEL